MAELDHLPRNKIGDVNPDMIGRQHRGLRDGGNHLPDQRVLALDGAAGADLAVDENLLAPERPAADEVSARA